MKTERKIHWPMLVGLTTFMGFMLVVVAIFRAEFFVVILPIIGIVFTTFVLYSFLLALGFGDKKPEETKEEKKDE